MEIEEVLKTGQTVIFELIKNAECPVEGKILNVYFCGAGIVAILIEIIGIPNNNHVVENKGAHYLIPWHSISNIRVMKGALGG